MSQGMSQILGGSLNLAEVEAMMYLPTRAPRSVLILVMVFNLARSKPSQPINQEVNQPINQRVNQSINPFISQLLVINMKFVTLPFGS